MIFGCKVSKKNNKFQRKSKKNVKNRIFFDRKGRFYIKNSHQSMLLRANGKKK